MPDTITFFDTGLDKLSILEGLVPEKMVLDATANDLMRMVLAQTIQHSISDYFSLYTVAATNAQSKAELDFTVDVTFWSTLYSTIILLPISIYSSWYRMVNLATEGTKIATSQITRMILKQVVGLATAPLAEILEEVYVDSFIEAYIEGMFAISGGDEQLARFVSMLVTSLRESSNVGIDMVMGAFGPDSDSSSNAGQSLETQRANLDQDTQFSLKSLISTDTVVGLLMSVAGFFVGGTSLGLGFLGGTLFDTMSVPMEEFSRVQTSKNVLKQFDKEVSKLQKEELLDAQNEFNRLIQQLRAKPSKFPLISNPDRAIVGTAPQLRALSPLTSEMSSFFEGTSQDILTQKEETFANMQTNHMSLKGVEKTTPLDEFNDQDTTHTVITEYSIAEALDADPVDVSESGVTTWIQPLPAKLSASGREMTLNEFLAIRGVLNDPNKHIEFNGYKLQDGEIIYSETYSFPIPLDGNAPLSMVLDLVGYDNSPEALLTQFHGESDGALQLIDKNYLTPIPVWMFEQAEDIAPTIGGYEDVINFINNFNYRTRGNLLTSVKNGRHVLVVDNFLEQIFEKLELAFKDKFGISDSGSSAIIDMRVFVEDGLWNLFDDFLIKPKLKNIDPAYHQRYIDFVKDLFEFKFLNILDNTGILNINRDVREAVRTMIFDFLAQEEYLDLKSRTTNDFINELDYFTQTVNFDELLDGVLDNSMLSKLFLVLSEGFMSTVYDEGTGEKMGGIKKSQHTFHGWIDESKYIFFKYIDRVTSILIDNEFNVESIFQWVERNPKYFNREKARLYNIDLLKGMLKEIREAMNNGIDTTEFLSLPVNSREYDIAVLLLLGSVPTLHSTHLKAIRADLLNDPQTVLKKLIAISQDGLGILLEGAQYWFSTSDFHMGDIQGINQISDFGSPVFVDKASAQTTLRFIMGEKITSVRHHLEGIESTDQLEEKGPLDLQVCHQVTSLLNEKYIKGEIYLSLKDLKDDVFLLLSENYVEQEIREIIKNIYKKSSIKDYKIDFFGEEIIIGSKWDEIELKWNIHYANVKNLFTKKLDSIIQIMPNNKYELIWKDIISHSFLKFDQNKNPILLEASMFLGDGSILGLFDPSSANSFYRPSPDETFRIPLVVYHHKVTGKNILVKSNEIHLLSNQYKFGYRNPSTGEVIEDAILNTKEGFVLEGRISFYNGKLVDNGLNWLTKGEYLDKGLYFYEQYGEFSLRHCYRYINFLTGENSMPFLQSVTYNFVETKPYEAYFGSEGTRKHELVTRAPISILTTDLSSSISIEEFNKFFFNVFDFRRVGRTYREITPCYYAIGKWGQLNLKFNPLTGAVDSSSSRDILDLEGFVKYLCDNDQEIQKFLFLDEDKNPSLNADLTLKEWINWLYNKIINTEIDPVDRSSIILKNAKDKLSKIAPLSIVNDREVFSVDNGELTRGLQMLSVLSDLIGHITLEFILFRMMTYYKMGNNYKILPTTTRDMKEIQSFMNQFDIHSSSQYKPGTDLSLGRIKHHLFSLFFSNSFLSLPTDIVVTDDSNKFLFGYSPMPFLTSDATITQRFLGKEGYDLSKYLESQFKKHYTPYQQTYIQKSSVPNLDLFIQSSQNIFPVVEDKIIDHISSIPGLTLSQKERLISEAITTAYKELFQAYGYRLHGHKLNLRAQIESMLISDQFSAPIEFYKIIIDNQPLAIQFNKDDFKGLDIKIWRNLKHTSQQDLNSDEINSQSIKMKTKILKNIILESGGKVRIFPTLNTGADFGYQYIYKDSSSISYQFFPYLPDGVQYFDIDFNTDSLAYEKLEYIVRLSMIYTSAYDADSGVRELLFIMKGIDGSGNYRDVDYRKFICSFNHRKLFKLMEIFSSGTYSTANVDIWYQRISINGMEGVFQEEILDFESTNRLWMSFHKYVLLSDKDFIVNHNLDVFFA